MKLHHSEQYNYGSFNDLARKCRPSFTVHARLMSHHC